MSRNPEPGWYPDPASQGSQLRYWDGSAWTDRTAPFAPPDSGGGRGGGRSGSWFRGALAVVFPMLVVAAAVVYGMARNQDVAEVEGAGVRVSFASSGPVSTREIEEKQAELEEKLQTLEQSARSSGGSKARPSTTADLSGDWVGINGLLYRIEQHGNRAVVSEITSWGITATGEGTVRGKTGTFTYQAADGTRGEAKLTLVNDSTLEGTFTNFATGMTTPARMTR